MDYYVPTFCAGTSPHWIADRIARRGTLSRTPHCVAEIIATLIETWSKDKRLAQPRDGLKLWLG
jgi:hypothetical protein